MTTALIDGDIFCFQAATSAEYIAQWDAWLWTRHANLNQAIIRLDDSLNDIAEQIDADRVVIALSHKDNFRKTIYPEYKFNRKSTPKPVIYQALRDYLHETREVFERPGLEGDDVLGILLTHPKMIPGRKICVSLDKDMQTLPGLHLNDGLARKLMAKDRTLMYEDFIRDIEEGEADTYHMMQTLSGDSTDGYPGCPGMGELGAAKLISAAKVLEPKEHTLTRGPRKGQTEMRWEPGAYGTQWEIVLSAYRKAGLGAEIALTQARVARICRWQDYDFTKKEVKLWNASST